MTKHIAEIYLENHGISKETAEMFELTWDENLLSIPVKDEDGEDLFIKFRNLHFGEEGNTEPKYKNSINSHATLFNLYAVKDTASIAVTEGELDTMKLMQEGIPAISSTGGARTFPDEFVEQLQNKKIWICLDNDEAGERGIYNILEKLPNARVIQLPV